MQAKPLVSIIINNFNKARYLEQCLNSVADQTVQDYEVIFWNDNSTDDSADVFFAWRDSQPEDMQQKFNWFSTDYEFDYPDNNDVPGLLPLGVTRWLALQQCTGKYVALLDSDDFWREDKLEKQLRLFNMDMNVGLVFSDCYYYRDGYIDGTFHKRYPPSLSRGDLLLKYNFMPASTVVFDREKLMSVVGAPSHYTSGEDYDWLLKVTERCNYLWSPEPLAHYRIVSDSLTHDPRKSTRATWYEIDAAIGSYRRCSVSKLMFVKHLIHLYLKLIWKQFIREKF